MSESKQPIRLEAFRNILLHIRMWVLGLTGWRRYGLACVMGLASALAFAPYYCLPLLVVGFTCLVWLMDSAASHKKKRLVGFFTGFWFAYGYILLSIYWMTLSFMVHAQDTGQLIFLGVAGALGVLGLTAYLVFYVSVASLFASWFWRPGWSRVLLLAGLWTIGEYFRGHMLTGLPWNLPGQALAGKAVLSQLSAYVGPYGLSLILLILAMLPAAVMPADTGRMALTLRAVSLKPLGFFLGGWVVLLLVGFIRLSGGPVGFVDNVRLQIVQPSINQKDKIDYAKFADNFLVNVTLSGGEALADIGPAEQAYVIWPENAAYSYFQTSVDALEIVAQSLPPEALLLSGAQRTEENADGTRRYFNSFHVIADVPVSTVGEVSAVLPVPRQRAIIHTYDKHHLVPFGEFVPAERLLRTLGLDKILPISSAFTRGSGPATLALGATKVAPIICYETIFAGEVYPREERPDWLLVVTNDAWFGDSAAPGQHLDMARLRAIETGLPIARSANAGISAIIDPYGRLLDSMGLYERGAIVTGLPKKIKTPLYSRIGELGFLILLVFVIGGAFWEKKKTV